MRLTFTLGVWVTALVHCGCSSTARVSETTDIPLIASRDPNAQSAIESYEAKAKASKDPVAVWIQAFKEDHPDVVTAALIRIHGSNDPRLVEPIRTLAQDWKPRGGHDRPAISDHAAGELEFLQGELLWRKAAPPSLTGLERFERIIELASSNPKNQIVRQHILEEFLRSTDPRIIPFLTTSLQPEASEKVLSFGNLAVPNLLENAFSQRELLVRETCIDNLANLKAPEAVPKMIEALLEIRKVDVIGSLRNPQKSELRGALVMALSRYGDGILPQLTSAATAAQDPLVRASVYGVIGEIGGPNALAFLKEAREKETSRDDSDSVNVLSSLNYHIKQIENGK